MLALIVAEGFAIALLGLLVAGLLRSHAEILRALHELGASINPDDRPAAELLRISPRPPDAPSTAYDITGAGLDDDIAALAIAGAPQPTLLAFLTSGCATCGTFWTAFRGGSPAVPGAARLVIVAKDASEESPARLRELAPPDVTLVLSSAAWADYRVPASPYFVYVDGELGVIGEGAAASWPQVASLMEQARSDASPRFRRPGGRGAGQRADSPEPADSPGRIDAELLAAGIGPGHPSLYAAPPAAAVDTD